MEKFSLSFDLNYLKMVAQGIFLPLIVKNQRRQHPFVQPTTLIKPLNVTRNDVCDSAFVNLHVACTRENIIIDKVRVLQDCFSQIMQIETLY